MLVAIIRSSSSAVDGHKHGNAGDDAESDQDRIAFPIDPDSTDGLRHPGSRIASGCRPPERVAILQTSVASPIRRLAWLVPQILVILAVGKALQLIEIDKLHPIAVRQLDEAQSS